MSSQPPRRPPPNFPKEEPGEPLEPAVAKTRATYIRAQIEKIKVLKEQGKSESEIRESEGITRFSEDYPQLFKMVLKVDITQEANLRVMLAMLDRMGSGQFTQDQASVIIGQKLHDTYIKPKIDKQE